MELALAARPGIVRQAAAPWLAGPVRRDTSANAAGWRASGEPSPPPRPAS